ncbi:hypothetical protein BDZ90DRAFT_107200 [Jaminaea rosea]|uniref:Uncharacterized protein n=1 Tax=Jaminaea rosea TaxID=1569628 RepID=A0A316UYJ5_9BASI|nr:hypothetical protein BDZ90DRAFT_107200 [Jaminaea rosea]PWN29381.1 hypothetical protein BDZ90DRAFT_107200 [Jaminaea rosea]
MIFPPAFAKSNCPGCCTPLVADEFAKEKPVLAAGAPNALPDAEAGEPPKEKDVLGVAEEAGGGVKAELPPEDPPKEKGFVAPEPLLAPPPKLNPVLEVNGFEAGGEAEDPPAAAGLAEPLAAVVFADPNEKPPVVVKGETEPAVEAGEADLGAKEKDGAGLGGAADAGEAAALSACFSCDAADASSLPLSELEDAAAPKSTFFPPKANPPLGSSNVGRSFGFSTGEDEAESALLKALPPKEKPPVGAGANLGGPLEDEDAAGAVEEELDTAAAGFAAGAVPFVAPPAAAFPFPAGAGASVGGAGHALLLTVVTLGPLCPLPSLSLTSCALFPLYRDRIISTTGARSSNSWSTSLPSRGMATSSVLFSEWFSPLRARR